MKTRHPPTHQIEMRIAELSQLFNSMDPTPFHHRDLDTNAERYLESWALGQVEFELAGDSVLMTRLDPIEHTDPDIQAMLQSVQMDIAMGRKLGLLEEPQSILGALVAMTAPTKDVKAKIVGDVSL